MKIRYMTIEDVDAIVSLENRVWTAETTPAPLPISDPNKVLEKFEGNTHYLIAEDEKSQDLLGVLDFHPFYPFDSGKHIVTFGIAVNPDSQNEGVGKALIDHFLATAKADDYRKVVIHVLGINQNAMAFYQAMGFKEEARLTKMFDINGEQVDDVMFTYDLEDFNA